MTQTVPSSVMSKVQSEREISWLYWNLSEKLEDYDRIQATKEAVPDDTTSVKSCLWNCNKNYYCDTHSWCSFFFLFCAVPENIFTSSMEDPTPLEIPLKLHMFLYGTPFPKKFQCLLQGVGYEYFLELRIKVVWCKSLFFFSLFCLNRSKKICTGFP